MKDREDINLKYINNILKQKGYILNKKSDNYSDIRKIEYPQKGAKYDANKLFNLFTSKPICRLIFQYMLVERIDKGNDFVNIGTCTDFIYDIVKGHLIQRAIGKPPVYIFVCPNCKSSDFIEIVRGDSKRLECQNCGNIFSREKREKIESWEKIGLFDIYHVLSQLFDTGFVVAQNQLTCYECEEIEIAQISKIEKRIKCEKCGNYKDLKKVYSTIKFLGFKDIKATWLEWYVFKILKEKCDNINCVIPPYLVKNLRTDDETEVDILAITKTNKIIAIDCKAKFLRSSVSKTDINNNILEWMHFSDYLFIISTTEYSPQTKRYWTPQISDCEPIFIQGNEIEKLPDIIKEM